MTASTLPDRIEFEDGVALDLFRLEHAAELFALINAHRAHFGQYDPYISTDLSTLDQVTTEIRQILKRIADGTCLTRGIWVADELVGRFGVLLEPENRHAQLGYMLAPPHQGRRIITRTGRLMLRHLFQDLGYREVYLKTDPHNRPSQHVAERLGMTDDHGIHEMEGVSGETIPMLRYVISAADWRRLQA